jgi:hypothetical protein
MIGQVARYYGLNGGPASDAYERVTLDPAQRGGVLTQGLMLSVLTPGTHTNPTMRGVFVLERLLCTPPPDPPPTLNVQEPKYDAGQTTRERFAVHATNQACAGCHRLMDPIGFALENYDAIGRWRTTENGKSIDAVADLHGDVDIAGRLNGPIDLVRKLAASAQVRRCYVGHWFTFAHGRAETPRDQCARAALERTFAQSGHKIRDLLLGLTQTDAFLLRPVP